MRVSIDKGLYIRPVNVVHLADTLTQYFDCQVYGCLEYQTYHLDTGVLNTGTYRGQAEVVRRGIQAVIVIGDLVYSPTLTELLIADKATEESEVRLAQQIAGVNAALGGFKKGRRLTSKGVDWLDGYDQALRCREEINRA